MRPVRLLPAAAQGLRRERPARPGPLPTGRRRMTTLTKGANRTKVRTYPVIEIFGPTIQGEGAEAGIATHFVRVGGCDYRCSWCDTMYAVDPATVRATARHLSAGDIADEIGALDGAPEWVTISGGNPALHHLGPLVDDLHD